MPLYNVYPSSSTSAQLAGSISDETGTGALVLANTPTLITPVLGVATATSFDIGHASDTTLSRSGSGDLQIETNIIYRAGGTDVAVADGGTGSSTALAAITALGLGQATLPRGRLTLTSAAPVLT